MVREDRSCWVALFYDDAPAMRAWLVRLGFEEGVVVPGEAGRIHHSEMLWPEGGRVMVASRDGAAGEYAAGPAGVYVVARDPDDVHARALALGAEVIRPLEDAADFEQRGFTIRDPEKGTWSFGTYCG